MLGFGGSDPRYSFEFLDLFDLVHAFFVAGFAPKRKCARLYILTLTYFTAL
jgi:hypothetical protein